MAKMDKKKRGKELHMRLLLEFFSHLQRKKETFSMASSSRYTGFTNSFNIARSSAAIFGTSPSAGASIRGRVTPAFGD
jgi:hypothetical protein